MSQSEFLAEIERGDSNRVAALLASGDVDVNDELRFASVNRFTDDFTPLRLAAFCGHAAIAAQLLDAGAFIDMRSGNRKDTACHSAARRKHAAVVDVLAARGANLTVRNKDKDTPISIAARIGSEAVTTALIEAGAPLPLDDSDALCFVASVSRTAIRLLLEHGVYVGALRTDGGGTLCHSAAWIECTPNVAAAIDMLVTVAGVDLSVRDLDDRSCCALATECANWPALRRFIQLGADVDQGDRNGWTPLHAACYLYQHSPCAVILLAAGASVHVRDGEGRTACHLAGDQDMLDDLIAAGADFDAADSNGRTPRQNATDHCLPEPTAERVAAARRRIAHARLDFVRERAFQVCIGLQSLELDALQTCEVLLHSCGPVAPLVPFHHWWTIATTVKHFKQLQ